MFSRADAYERFMGRWSRLLAPELIRFAGVCDGDAVLDVGCGTGALSFAVCNATRAARVTGIDASEDYVSHAARSSDEARLVFEVGDARSLRFANATFDRTLSLLVLNFVPDPARALDEWVRVTRPGGVVSAAVWDYGEGMQMLRFFWDEATALDPGLAPRDEANMPLCRQGELATLWRRQGLDDVEERALGATLHFGSFDDYWAPFLLGQGPAGPCVANLPEDRRAKLAQRLAARLLGEGANGPIDLQARAWAVKGTAPRR